MIATATVETPNTQWPLGEQGLGTLRLVPGNVYVLKVTALDAEDRLLGRYRAVRVWAPWKHRESVPPVDNRTAPSELPVSLSNWWLQSHHLGDGRELDFRQRFGTLRERTPRARSSRSTCAFSSLGSLGSPVTKNTALSAHRRAREDTARGQRRARDRAVVGRRHSTRRRPRESAWNSAPSNVRVRRSVPVRRAGTVPRQTATDSHGDRSGLTMGSGASSAGTGCWTTRHPRV